MIGKLKLKTMGLLLGQVLQVVTEQTQSSQFGRMAGTQLCCMGPEAVENTLFYVPIELESIFSLNFVS